MTTGFNSLSETSTSLPRSRVFAGGEGEDRSGEVGSDLISSSSCGSGIESGGEGTSWSLMKASGSSSVMTEGSEQTVGGGVGIEGGMLIGGAE